MRPIAYGYQWWITTSDGAPAYAALGTGGQVRTSTVRNGWPGERDGEERGKQDGRGGHDALAS